MKRQPVPGQKVDAASTFPDVPGFAFPTDMRRVKATYRVPLPPFRKFGYYGLGLEMLEGNGKVVAIILVNRLFRLPLIFREPFGLLIDAATAGALLFGIKIAPVRAAANTASLLYATAAAKDVPLIFCGQSLAGGLAQYQAAIVHRSPAEGRPRAGFITYNAAHVTASIELLGGDPGAVPGINFTKDRDPGVGPYSFLPNRTGVQVYIHADGSGGLEPGRSSFFSALLHPWEHFLASFNKVDLGKILSELN